VRAILRDYSSYFIGANLADPLTEGLLALERNWRGPLATNDGVEETLARFQSMERAATPAQLRNWRFQQLLYRAYYDATIRARLRDETAREEGARSELQRATSVGSFAAIAAAEQRLAGPGAGAALRARVFELAESPFPEHSHAAQRPTLPRHRGGPRCESRSDRRSAHQRAMAAGAILGPEKTDRVRSARRQGVARLLTREDPGAGGYYDDLGQPGAQPHLVAGTAYADDPAMLRAPHWASSTSRSGPAHPRASRTYAEARDDQPLEMLYRGLDPKARYRVRIVYGLGDSGTRENPMTIRLVANQRHEIHGFRPKDPTGQPVEFAVPPEATQGGELRLTWSRPAGLGGNGRGVQVAEVWLLRDAAPTAAAAR
jgi:hypothetical protein